MLVRQLALLWLKFSKKIEMSEMEQKSEKFPGNTSEIPIDCEQSLNRSHANKKTFRTVTRRPETPKCKWRTRMILMILMVQ